MASGLVGPIIKVVKWVGAPILRQFKYLCCFTTNITNLKKEGEKLQDTERELEGRVDTARNDARVIYSKVETWLQNSKNIKDEMDGIINEVPNVESGWLKLRARFSLSKRAKKTIDRLKKFQGQCKFDADSMSRPGPPAATKVVPSERTYELESRRQIEEDIMATLRDGDVNIMGICGMGGLGKTTMAKRIMNRALEEHVFEEVVMAGYCTKLYARLSGRKRILLVLDDVWDRLVLEDLGIPRGYKGCTIRLTSRNYDVLSAMNVQKVFGI